VDYQGVRVLVTGADGFIGSHLTEALLNLGASVTALCLYNSTDSFGWIDELPCAAYSNLTAVRGDIRDAAFVRRIIEVQDVVFHLAALIAIPYSYVAPQSYVDTNVLGTINVLETARDSGVKRVIHTSTSEVYGSAITLPIDEGHPLHGQSPYSASKIGADMMAEAFARSFDLPVAILRPFNTFGPRQSERAIIPTLIRQILDPACTLLQVGDTSTIRDFTFVDDTVAAFLSLGSASDVVFGRPYNAGSGKAVSIEELLELVFSLSGNEKLVMQDRERMRPCESEVRALLADSSHLTALTGWEPRITLRDGLSRTITWWRARLATGRVRMQTRFVA
jgi:NAD dependent epimerase/dehydratase